jgi:hypothetical protein
LKKFWVFWVKKLKEKEILANNFEIKILSLAVFMKKRLSDGNIRTRVLFMRKPLEVNEPEQGFLFR